MSERAYQEASKEERSHFIRCGSCAEWIDCRDLDEVFQHETTHEPQPDIQYSGSQHLPPKNL